ncbi:cation:proton antiporter, partial [Nocardioides hankookensis]
LNDATALVLLRSAVAATAFSVWGVAWDFVLAVVVAVAIGLVVGRLNLVVRSRIHDTAVNTAISFAVPFVAYLPAEHLGASGLVAAVTAFASRLGVAAPLLLVVVGVVASLLPGVPEVDIDPEWVLIGVLPPLLYSASVSMPAMDFRRDFTAIGSLSVVLVVVSAVVVGAFLAAVVPGIELRTGIALGAIISPTDAVATTIVKRLGVSPRVIAVLQGESLLNDATALVLLRSAVAATAFSVWGVAWDFVLAVVVAVAIGLV